jgi:MFS family permease
VHEQNADAARTARPLRRRNTRPPTSSASRGRCDVRLVLPPGLYLQLVLGYSPLQVGLAFLPANVIMAVLSLGLSAKLVLRFGVRAPLAIGLLLAAAGLALFARAPVDGAFVTDVLPSMILLGLGAGMAFNPLLLAAMSDVQPNDAGLASGLVNTSFMMGGALGLAILASLAASERTLLASGTVISRHWHGYHAAFLKGPFSRCGRAGRRASSWELAPPPRSPVTPQRRR